MQRCYTEFILTKESIMDMEQFVEMIARMNYEERNEFAETLVKKWPDLAKQIMNLISIYDMAEAHKNLDQLEIFAK